MQLADPGDWCTISWAAERIGCSTRTVRRLISAGTLRSFYPRKGTFEKDPQVMLSVADVERHATARLVVAGRA
jgi:excisionase family DNA binding protein